jgi:hypothetical protein
MTRVDDAPGRRRSVPGAATLAGAGIFLRERITGITGILKPPRDVQHTPPLRSGDTRTPPNSTTTAASRPVPTAHRSTLPDRSRPHSQMQNSNDSTGRSASMPPDGYSGHR